MSGMQTKKEAVADRPLPGSSSEISARRPIAPGTMPIAAGAGIMAAVALFVTLWALAPDVVALVPSLQTAGQALLGSWPASLGSAAVFDIAALIGLASLARADKRLKRESIAAGEAVEICRDNGPGLLKSVRQGQSPFFSAGFSSIRRIETTAAYIMAENIRKDAENYRYEPIAMILDRVGGRISAGTGHLRDAQQVGLRLGILGTFLGMTFALLQLTTIFATEVDEEASRNAIQGIIEQLSLAFGTSIAGLSAAILLQVIAWGLKSREAAVFDLFQELAVSIQNIYRSAEMGGSIGLNMDLLKEEISEHRRDVASHKLIIGDYVAAMGSATREAATVFERPLDAIRQTGERLSLLLTEQDGALKSVEDTAKSVSALQSQVAGHFASALAHASETQRIAFAELNRQIALMSADLNRDVREGFQSDGRFREALRLEQKLAETAELLSLSVGQQKRMQRLQATALILLMLLTPASILATAWLLTPLAAASCAGTAGCISGPPTGPQPSPTQEPVERNGLPR